MALLTFQQEVLDYFATQHYKTPEQQEDYLVFARFVAVPLVISSDLLYKLWQNFKEQHFNISHLVVSDFLLSGLCEPIGDDLFKIEEDIRNHLLEKVDEDTQVIVALFLKQYVEHHKQLLSKSLQNIHMVRARWILDRESMAKEIIENTRKAKSLYEKGHWYRLYNDIRGKELDREDNVIILKEVSPNDKEAFPFDRMPITLQQEVIQYRYQTAKERIAECKRNRSIKLDLGRCNLTNLDDLHELLKCDWLEELILSNVVWIYEDGHYKDKQAPKDDRDNYFSAISRQLLQLPKLRKLACGGWGERWPISDCSILAKMPNLVELDLSRNQIEDITFLANLKRLRHLKIGNNQIKDITPLHRVRQLTSLEINNNLIEDITPLRSLTQLEQLNISNNQVFNIEALANLRYLNFLDIHSNPIKDLSPIFPLIQGGLPLIDSGWQKGKINIKKLPVVIPPKMVIEKGYRAVLNYIEPFLNGNYQKPCLLFTFANSPKYPLPALKDEMIGIQNSLAYLGKHDWIKTINKSKVNYQDMLDGFKAHAGQINVFHFAGNSNKAGILLTDQLMPIDELILLLIEENRKGNIALVFLNSCRVANVNMAKIILEGGIDALIMAPENIDDKAAAQFSIEFYRNFAAGQNIIDAYKKASEFIIKMKDDTTTFEYVFRDPVLLEELINTKTLDISKEFNLEDLAEGEKDNAMHYNLYIRNENTAKEITLMNIWNKE